MIKEIEFKINGETYTCEIQEKDNGVKYVVRDSNGHIKSSIYGNIIESAILHSLPKNKKSAIKKACILYDEDEENKYYLCKYNKKGTYKIPFNKKSKKINLKKLYELNDFELLKSEDLNKHQRNYNRKKVLLRIMLIISVIEGVFLGDLFSSIETKINNTKYEKELEQYSDEELQQFENQLSTFFNKNNKLENHEVEVLYNKDFLEDIQNTEMDESRKRAIMRNLETIDVDDMSLRVKIALYMERMILKRDYETMAYVDDKDYNKNTIHLNEKIPGVLEKNGPHEFVHTVSTIEYPYLSECFADICAREYYDEYSESSYLEAQRNVMYLMEIIGPKAVWDTVIAANDEQLQLLINQYLDEENSKTLLMYLKGSPLGNTQSDSLDIYLNVQVLLDLMYRNKYHESPEKNAYIKAIMHYGGGKYIKVDKENILVRMYFNSRNTKNNIQANNDEIEILEENELDKMFEVTVDDTTYENIEDLEKKNIQLVKMQ